MRKEKIIMLLFSYVLKSIMAVIFLFLSTGALQAMPPYKREFGPGPVRKEHVYYLDARGRLSSTPGPRLYKTRHATTGTQQLLAVLVDFPDLPYTSISGEKQGVQYWNDLLASSSTRSVAAYFREVSYSKLEIVAAIARKEGVEGDGAYWFRSSKNYSYWAADTATPIGAIDDRNEEIYGLVREALGNIDPYVDFSRFDMNGDRIISPDELHILIIHSGLGQEYTGNPADIWSHRWSVEPPASFDGVQVAYYSMTSKESPLGTIVHEIGHDIGLPDLYDTGDGNEVIGKWCLMDQGAWNSKSGEKAGTLPAHPSAWCKAYLGWTIPDEVAEYFKGEILASAASGAGPRILKIPVPGKNEYFLIENRNKVSGTFDEALPGNGIVIYHIDDKIPYEPEGYNAFPNDSTRHNFYKVQIENPYVEGSVQGGIVPNDDPNYRGRTEYAYFASDHPGRRGGYTEFGPHTHPPSRANDRTPTRILVHGIGAGSPRMPLTVGVEPPRISLLSPTTPLVNVSGNIEIAWSASDPGGRDISVSLYYNRDTDNPDASGWTEIAGEIPLATASTFSWDTTTVQDGNYYIKLIASNGFSSSWVISPVISIDNPVHFSIVFSPPAINLGELEITITPSEKLSGEVAIDFIDAAGRAIPFSIISKEDSEIHLKAVIDRGVAEGNATVKVEGAGLFDPRPGRSEGTVPVDRTPPVIRISYFLNPVLTDSLWLFVTGNEPLSTANASATNSRGQETTLSLTRRNNSRNTFYAQYELLSSDTLIFTAVGKDLAGNESQNITTTASVARLKAEEKVKIGPLAVRLLERGNLEGRFILLNVSRADESALKRKGAGKQYSEEGTISREWVLEPDSLEGGGRGFEIVFPPLPGKGGVEVYRVEEQTMVPLEIMSDGDSITVTSKKLGKFLVRKNDRNHAIVPVVRYFGSYPNPAKSSSVTFFYDLETAVGGGESIIRIYDLAGTCIRELSGTTGLKNAVLWDGLDERGRELSNGTYIWVLKVLSPDGEIEKRGKITLLR